MAQLGVGSSSGVNIYNTVPKSGLLALGSNSGDLAVVKLATNEITHRQLGARTINRVKFSPDGKFLFASGLSLYKFPVEDLNQLIQFYSHNEVIGDFCLDWEHSRVYICSPHKIRLWDLRAASPYHTFVPERQTSCIDILSSENVLLSGDSMGYLNSWNLRMMKEECSLVTLVPSMKKKTGITSIAVCPDSSWICAGTKGGDVYEYKYGDEKYMFQHAIPGKQEVRSSVVQVTFPRAATGPAVVAFEEQIGQYDPFKYKPNDTNITWIKEISSGIDGSKISCCTVDSSSTIFFSGHTSGHVISYALDSGHIRTLPITYDRGGGAISSLDFVHT